MLEKCSDESVSSNKLITVDFEELSDLICLNIDCYFNAVEDKVRNLKKDGIDITHTYPIFSEI